VLDAMNGSEQVAERRRDIMFTHCGGKHRLPVAVSALRHLDVPVGVVADFDVLREEQPLKRLVELLGGEWSSVEPVWKRVKAHVDAQGPELSVGAMRAEILRVLSLVDDSEAPERLRREIEATIRKSTAWSKAKRLGMAALAAESAKAECDQLLSMLRNIGLFVVVGGELECFDRSVGKHGPAWVNEVLAKDLTQAPSLEAARSFVRVITA